MDDVLKKIYASKARHLDDEMQREPYDRVRQRAHASVAARRPFLGALRANSGCAIVAEIKRASPSAGLIARNFDPAAIGRTYHEAGVDAISILTEQDHFLGDLAFLSVVRGVTDRPLLRKDFLSTPYQVAQSAAYGADCILLIVGGLSDDQLGACMSEAREYELDVLVEVHDEKDLKRAAAANAQLVGVNNRNLRTMVTDLAVSEHLLPLVPREIFAISESGMRNLEDLERLRHAGARGFLIGEALMRSEDPEALLRSLRQKQNTLVG
jgi:indole-3-glycerol phosphate synthase